MDAHSYPSRDAFGLQRFVEAQKTALEAARRELRSGRKQTHWMWFIFPQLRGLGSSAMAERYGISGNEEARAYLAHPLLGPRLVECAGIVNDISGRSISDVFGYPDNLKFHSSMTLFAQVQGAAASELEAQTVFQRALAKYFGGRPDESTLALLRGSR